MLNYCRLLAFLLICLVSDQAIAATNDVAISLYNRWERLPSEQLMKMGERYRCITRQPDSALVCFSIVANRYYQGHQTRDDMQHAIEAMTHITWVYMHDLYDYTQAVKYNLQAKELAEKYQCLDYMPYIIINNANIHKFVDYAINGQKFSEKALNIYKDAFNLALKQKNWDALDLAFLDMMLATTFNDKESMIEREMDILMSDAVPDTIVNTQYARCLIRGVRVWNNNLPDSALTYFKRLLDIAQLQKEPRQKLSSIFTANDYIACWYQTQGKPKEYIEVLKTIEQLSKDNNNVLALISNYKNLSKYYNSVSNQQMALHYHMLYLESKDELVNKRKLGSAKEAQFLYELNKKNEEVREMAYRDQVKNRMMWSALITALVLLTLLVLLWVNNCRIKEHNRQLYNKSLEMLRADEEKRQLIEQLQSVPVEESPIEETSPYAPSDKPQREGKLKPAHQSELLHRVFMVMETSDEIYSPDFTLPRLAELVGDTRNNVSEAINQRYQGNFNALVNEYRVKEACRRINDRTQWSDYTLEAIGQSVGFKSRSTFWTVFKDIIGLTPGAYQRQSN